MSSMAEQAYKKLLEKQIQGASGARLELLMNQGEGERKLMIDIIWPVRKSFDGITLEKEIVTLTGIKAYIDAFDESVAFGLEGEGFAVHAGNITRSRFDFERNKVRSMAALGIRYIPFTFDEMNKKSDACRRALFELYGRYGTNADSALFKEATLYEREVIRYALQLGRPIRMSDVRRCLRRGPEACREVLRAMMGKGLIKPEKEALKRNRAYVLDEESSRLLW